MGKAVKAAVALLCSACFVMTFGLDVDISGTATKNGGGALQGAIVTLSKVKSLAATTDAQGKFALKGTVGVLLQLNSPQVALLELRGNILTIAPASAKVKGRVDVFSGIGRRTASIPLHRLHAGKQSMTIPTSNPGLNIVRITLGGEVYTCQVVRLGKDMYFMDETSGINAERRSVLAKRLAAAKDTLIVTKAGFGTKKTAVESYSIPTLAVSVDSSTTVENQADETSFKNAKGLNGGVLFGQFWGSADGYNGADTTIFQQHPQFFQCVQCHGYDLLGRAGEYVNFAPSNYNPSVADVNLWASAAKSKSDLFKAIKTGSNASLRRSKTADLSTYNPESNKTVGDKMPSFSEILSDAQIWDIVKFLQTEAIDMRQLYDFTVTGSYPTGTVKCSNFGKGGSAASGKDLYANLGCSDCHGKDGTEGGMTSVGNSVRSLPDKACFVIKFGIPGIMDAETLSVQQLKDFVKALSDSTVFK
jgi:mono/diheme cytochrome c family protein